MPRSLTSIPFRCHSFPTYPETFCRVSGGTPKQLHVTDLPCHNGEECSLIIPNASTHGPPTSSAVQVNPGKILCGSFTRTFPVNRVRSATASALWQSGCRLLVNEARRNVILGIGFVHLQ